MSNNKSISKKRISNKELLAEIIKSKEQGELTPEALDMIENMANRAINRLRYKNELDREDGIQTAIMKVLMYWDRFDETKYTNAFAYFTQIMKHAYVESFNKLHPDKSANMVSLSHESIHLF